MNESPPHPALLPAGLRDVLPPEAEQQARSIAAIMDCFAAHGYQRVAPPLIEFEDSLFAGSGAATAEQTFRLMDPESQRMMGLRADTTPQIARLATTRLSAAPRPLRLAYAGPCLKVRGSHLAPERQLNQAGIELIGDDTAAADAEIILTAAEALAAIGLTNISFDLTIPRLALTLLEDFPPAERATLTRALDRKDGLAVARAAGTDCAFLRLLEACGPAARAVPALLAVALPPAARAQAERLADAVAAITTRNPSLPLTIDPVEFRGYQYHTGLCITVFAPGHNAELGRGGRYLCGNTEPATGITLYPDVIVRAAPALALRPRIYLPHGTSPADGAGLRARGYATIPGLAPSAAPAAEAARLACPHVFLGGAAVSLKDQA